MTHIPGRSACVFQLGVAAGSGGTRLKPTDAKFAQSRAYLRREFAARMMDPRLLMLLLFPGAGRGISFPFCGCPVYDCLLPSRPGGNSEVIDYQYVRQQQLR